jgi:hypothetical protein
MVPVITMLFVNDVMLVSMLADTVRVRVAWVTALAFKAAPFLSHKIVRYCDAVEGDQLLVAKLSVSRAEPVFLM